MISFSCPSCKAAYQVQDDAAGNKTNCRSCGQRLQIPVPLNKTILGEPLAIGTHPSPLTPSLPVPPLPSPPQRDVLLTPILPPGWFYLVQGQQIGPVSEQGMLTLIRRGEVRRRDLVWTDGMADWVEAMECFRFPSRRSSDYDRADPDEENKNTGGLVCSILACVFGCLAFLLCPPFFGLAGITLGIVGTCLCKNKALGVVGLCLSVVGMIIGIILGAMMATHRGF